MKKLTVNSLAFASLKSRKRQYLVMFVSIILAMVLSSGMIFFLFASAETLQAQKYSKYGKQTHIVYTAENSETVYEDAVSAGVLAEYGLAHLIGFGYTDALEEEMGTSVAWLDDKAKALSNQSFLDGAYPEKEGEIAMEQTALLRLGLENAQVGDEITLSLKVQNNNDYLDTIEKTYILTGIVSDKKSNLQNGWGSGNMYSDLIPAAFVAAGTQTQVGGLEKLVAYVAEKNYSTMNMYKMVEYFYTDGTEEIFTGNAYLGGEGEIFSAISSGSGWAVLIAAVLLLTSCIAIVNTFNTNLKERRSQIGMLRAVGATKRQIVLIFGREAFIISLICTPLSLALSYVAVKLIIRILSDEAVMTNSLWVLALSAVLGVVITMAASLVPLLSASRITPLQAIRDTVANRKMKTKKIKSKKDFNPERHLAKRSLTFYSGAKAAVGVILTVVILFSSLGFSYYFAVRGSLHSYQADYSVSDASNSYYFDYFNMGFSGISESDMAEINANPYFSDVTSQKILCAQLHVDSLTDTDYFLSLSGSTYTIFDGDTDGATYENFAEALKSKYSDTYLQEIADWGYTDYFFPMTAYSFNNEAVEALSGKLTDGEIDLSALSSGDEVILVAPQTAAKAVKITENRGTSSYSAADGAALQKGYQIVCSDTCPYTVGDKISISIINYESEDAYQNDPTDFTRIDKEVTIAAIVSPEAIGDDETLRLYSDFGIITTHSGMQSFCDTVKYDSVSMDVSESIEIDDTVDDSILDFLNPIANKYNAYVESNYAYNLEQKESNARLSAALSAIAIIGFAVAGSIINNALTATIREGKREIGTLRAVGAAEKELVKSYIHRLLSMFSAGLIAGFLGFIVVYLALYIQARVTETSFDFVFFPWAAIGLCAVIFAVSSVNLYSKIRKEMKNSIVENIREL